jgi:hypothetical protein
MRHLLIAAGLAFGVSGCASIVSGSTQTVNVSAPEGAQVSVKATNGSFSQTLPAPATLSLPKGAGYFKHNDYVVEVSKPGFETQTSQLVPHMSGWYTVGNLFFGGLIGWFGVDPATGAMWTYDKQIDATLRPLETANLPVAPAVSSYGRKTTATTLASPSVVMQPADHSQLKLGRWSYDADKLARARGCVGDGAWLITQSGAFEAYRVFCDNGSKFTAVCDSVHCAEDR